MVKNYDPRVLVVLLLCFVFRVNAQPLHLETNDHIKFSYFSDRNLTNLFIQSKEIVSEVRGGGAGLWGQMELFMLTVFLIAQPHAKKVRMALNKIQ